jgi:hypothetical protein
VTPQIFTLITRGTTNGLNTGTIDHALRLDVLSGSRDRGTCAGQATAVPLAGGKCHCKAFQVGVGRRQEQGSMRIVALYPSRVVP